MNNGIEAFRSQLQKELGLSIGPKDPLLALWVSQKELLEQNAAQQQKLLSEFQAALGKSQTAWSEQAKTLALDLNNLAQLLKATNRLGEAEPMMRRALLILLKFTREIGHLHPDLRGALKNYSGLLKEMSLGDEEIRKRLVQVGIDAGFDLQSYGKLLGQLL